MVPISKSFPLALCKPIAVAHGDLARQPGLAYGFHVIASLNTITAEVRGRNENQ
jgi:hypothetical protein